MKPEFRLSASFSGFPGTAPGKPRKSISCSCGGKPRQRRRPALHGGTIYRRPPDRLRAALPFLVRRPAKKGPEQGPGQQ